MAEIQLRDVEKYFGENYVIRKLNLTIGHKEFVVLLGPSGCGKTTTLRAIAGLEDINTGDILIDGTPVQDRQAGDRDIAFVFQLFALYPHLTAYDNIAFPLRATRRSKSDVDAQVRQVAKSLQIEHLLGKRPSALSGGDMQRIAIGRALVRRPKAMLMDEPIGAPRRQAARGDAHRAEAIASGERADHRLRDPRSGRGHGAGRSHRNHE
jgi:multiple sugar transport system ATP-binding protein